MNILLLMQTFLCSASNTAGNLNLSIYNPCIVSLGDYIYVDTSNLEINNPLNSSYVKKELMKKVVALIMHEFIFTKKFNELLNTLREVPLEFADDVGKLVLKYETQFNKAILKFICNDMDLMLERNSAKHVAHIKLSEYEEIYDCLQNLNTPLSYELLNNNYRVATTIGRILNIIWEFVGTRIKEDVTQIYKFFDNNEYMPGLKDRYGKEKKEKPYYINELLSYIYEVKKTYSNKDTKNIYHLNIKRNDMLQEQYLESEMEIIKNHIMNSLTYEIYIVLSFDLPTISYEGKSIDVEEIIENETDIAAIKKNLCDYTKAMEKIFKPSMSRLKQFVLDLKPHLKGIMEEKYKKVSQKAKIVYLKDEVGRECFNLKVLHNIGNSNKNSGEYKECMDLYHTIYRKMDKYVAEAIFGSYDDNVDITVMEVSETADKAKEEHLGGEWSSIPRMEL